MPTEYFTGQEWITVESPEEIAARQAAEAAARVFDGYTVATPAEAMQLYDQGVRTSDGRPLAVPGVQWVWNGDAWEQQGLPSADWIGEKVLASALPAIGAAILTAGAGIAPAVAKTLASGLSLVASGAPALKPRAPSAAPVTAFRPILRSNLMGEDELFGDFSGFSGMGADAASGGGGFLSMSDWSKLGELALQVAANRSVNATTGLAMPLTPTMSGGAVIPAGFPGLAGLGAMARGIAPGAMMAAGAAAVGIVRSAAGRIIGWVLPSGTKVTRAAAVKLAKEMGLSVAAGAIGATAVDLAEAVMQQEGGGRRRSRGITGAQLRTTRRTMGKIERMHRLIVKEARKHHAR